MFWIGLFVSVALRPTTFTFVRHGETIANATGRYNARSLNTFSELGTKEVSSLTAELLKLPRFERILVSPSPRVMKTIEPYLRATHQKATIWPLLYECCTGRRPKGAHPTRFGYGPRIAISRELADLFLLLPGEDRFPIASNYDSGLAQVQAAVTELQSKFTGGRVLLVGHSGEGGHMIHALTGRWIRLQNATPVQFSLP